eukprot:XP_788619.2 PREDICTED: trafficking protein particle complex subunit 6B-like [Strongylocentrotus purpuratus]
MADDFIFDFLHMEIVNFVQRTTSPDDKDKVISKLEQMGYRVGQSLIEKFTRESPRFSSELDIIKFVCKDLWNGVYKKQVDNLRTNHQVSEILLRIP